MYMYYGPSLPQDFFFDQGKRSSCDLNDAPRGKPLCYEYKRRCRETYKTQKLKERTEGHVGNSESKQEVRTEV